ncbi:MAG: MFS transporter [Oligoflexia bacterium]|nr:MFS transporter [Oligoflexia bacterium]
MTPNYRRNIKLIYLVDFTWMFLVIIPLIVPFFKSIGLGMEQVYQVQAFFSVSILLLEIPSGYLSDIWGRKKTLMWGAFFHGLSFTLLPLTQNFWQLLVLEFLMAVSVSLFSGTDVALLYDSLNELDDNSEESSKIMGNKIFAMQTGETLAALLAGALSLYSALTLPLWLNAAISWLPFFLSFKIIEPNREKLSTESHKDNFKELYHILFKASPLVKLIVINTIVYGASSLLALWSFQDMWEKLGVPMWAFGPLWAALNLTVALIAKNAWWFENKIGMRGVLVIVGILPIVGYFGLAAGLGMIGILFCFCFQITRGLGQCVLKDALNMRITGKLRASANSVASLGVRGVFVLAGPALGYMLDNYGERTGHGTFALIYLICYFVFMIPLLIKFKEDQA